MHESLKSSKMYKIQWNNLTIHLMLIWIDEGRSISFHDSGLLPSDLLDRVTQQTVKKIQTDIFSVLNKLKKMREGQNVEFPLVKNSKK